MDSRYNRLPKRIKRVTPQNDDTPESKNQKAYTFYRTIVHPLILMLNNGQEKLNYALWLNRLDKEEANERKKNFIRIVFISLKRNHPFYLFLKPPPKDLSELNLDQDNIRDMIEYLQNNTENVLLNYENIQQKTKFKRFAAVSTDMNSYTTVKISKYLAQSFYAMSDFPINTWYNPINIVTPNNIDYNQWELYLNHFEIVSQDKAAALRRNDCNDIMKLDQVSKEGANTFIWHPHSVLKDNNRPKCSAGFNEFDKNISNQPQTQKQMDEAALAIIHKKTFPGYKMLNPRIYSTSLMPNPEFVFNTTGVKITYNEIPRGLSKNDKQQNQLKTQDEKKPSTCPFKRDNNVNSCVNNDYEISTVGKCTRSTKQLPCSNKTQKTNNCQNSFTNTTNTQTQRVKAGNGSELKMNKTYTCGLLHDNGKPSFSLKLLSKSLDSENRRMKHESKDSSRCSKQSQNYRKSNQTNNNDRNNHKSSSDSSNYDWTMSSIEMSVDRNAVPINTSTTNRECRNDQPSCIGSTNRNSCKNNHNDGVNHNRLRHNTNTNVSSHSDRSQIGGHVNGNANQSSRSNNASRHQNSKSRSVSIPCNSNRVHTNCGAKKEEPHSGNNKSCLANSESRNDKTCHKNMSAMPEQNCERSATQCCPRYYDHWDVDVGNYSEFKNDLKCRKQDQLMQRSSALNSTQKVQRATKPHESANWSDEISFRNLPLYESRSDNSSDSLSTLTTSGSSSDDIRPIRSDYRRDFTPDLNRFKNTRYRDCINFNNRGIEAVSTDSEGDDFTNEGIPCPFDNTQESDVPHLNIHSSTRLQNEINNNNRFGDSVSTIAEERDFMNEGIPCAPDNARQSASRSNWSTPNQNYQNLEDFNLSYISTDCENSITDDESSINDIEDTGSPRVIYQQQSLRDRSFRDSNIEDISIPDFSYDTSFSDYNESMDRNHNNIEDANNSQVIYQQQSLRDRSFRDSNIENTSMPELSYDTTFSDNNESMDRNHNNIEDTNNPQVIYQQQSLRNRSYQDTMIENTSMPDLSYDTSFLDYNESMDSDNNEGRNNCFRN